MNELKDKVESLKNTDEDHESKFQGLHQMCNQAEQRSLNLTELSKQWSGKVANLQGGLTAFEMTQIYETIADNLNLAYTKSKNNSDEYMSAKDTLEDFSRDSDKLKEDSELLLINAQNEIERKVKAEKDLDSMYKAFNELNLQKELLDKNVDKINQWINRTQSSDQTLSSLEAELNNQQVHLKTNEEKAKDLIQQIQTLDLLRNTHIPKSDVDFVNTPKSVFGKTQFVSDEDYRADVDIVNTPKSYFDKLPSHVLRQRRSEDSEEEPFEGGDDDEDGEDDGEDMIDLNIVDSIKGTIDGFKAKTARINAELNELQEKNNLNDDLEKIRDEIYELKLLIASTRDIANEIKVAVNFSDKTFIQLRPSANLVPSMSTTGTFHIQTKDYFAPIAFIYNESNPNEYMSLNLQNGKPHFQYRLSNESFTSVMINRAVNDGKWHKIEIERIGRRSKLSVDYEGKTEIARGESSDHSVIFNIDPNGAKFILGQYPTNKLAAELETIAAYNSQFKGAIDDVKLNGHAYGLWSYEAAKNIKGEPKRPLSAYDDTTEQDSGNSISFSEDSFMCLDRSEIKLQYQKPISITVKFKTDASNGLIWFWSNKEKQYIAIYLESGHLNVVVSFSTELKHYLYDEADKTEKKRLNDNKFHTVYVKLSIRKETKFYNSTFKFHNYALDMLASETLAKPLIFNNITYTMKIIPNLKSGQQCIGGIPENKREGIFKDSQFNGFVGCMSQLLPPGETKSMDLPELLLRTETKASRVLPKCTDETEQCRVKKSDNPVYLKFDLKQLALNQVEESIGLGFTTTNSAGTLLYRQTKRNQQTGALLLQLKDGKLVLTVHEDNQSSYELTASNKQYSDNNLHIVYIIKQADKLMLKVDDELVAESSQISNFNSEINSNLLYIAGIPDESRKSTVMDNFEGCITQLVYNNVNLKFKDAVSRSSEGLSFSNCFQVKLKSAVLAIPEYKKSSAVSNKKMISFYSQKKAAAAVALKNEECLLSKEFDTSQQMRSVGIRFGLTKNSRLEVHDSYPIKISTSISLRFRTLQPDGLLFYASDAQFSDFLAIWLQEGAVNYAYDLGSGLMHIRTQIKFNDGKYHSLNATRDMQSCILIMSDRSGQRIVETLEGKSLGAANSLSVVEPYYFGGMPDNDKHNLPPSQVDLIVTEPFIGCMSDLTIAHKQLRNRLQKIELMSCSNNHESGTFFTGNSLTSHASLPYYLSLSDAYEIAFEFKSRTKNGVVLYIGSANVENKIYALLELVNGELVYKLNLDGQENVARFTPEVSRNELCNSNWFRIKIKKELNGHVSLQLKGVEMASSFEEPVKTGLGTDMNSIFVGALPVRSRYAEITQTSEAFIGCIRDMSIKKSSNNYLSKALLEMNMEDGVLSYCPLK